MNEWGKTVGVPVITVMIGLIFGAFIVAISGGNVVEVFSGLLRGVTNSSYRWEAILRSTTPLLMTGLAAAFAFKGGMLNIGVEGQLYWGAIAAAWVGSSWEFVPGSIHLIAAVAAGFAAGAAWAWIAGFLRLRYGVSEFITTIMLADVAILLTSYIVNYVYFNPNAENPETPHVLLSAEIPLLFSGTNINAGILIGLGMVLLSFYIMWYTTKGFEMRMTGLNVHFSRYAGIDVYRRRMQVMLLSGGFAGVGGALEVLSVHLKFIDHFSPGYGWTGIVVALLGRRHPFGVTLAAVFFGIMHSGQRIVDRSTSTPAEVVEVVTAIIVLLLTAEVLITGPLNKTNKKVKQLKAKNIEDRRVEERN